VKWSKTEVEAAGMLMEAVVDREVDVSLTEVEKNMVVEGFLVYHKGQIQAAAAQDGPGRVDMDLEHSISVLQGK
jgi:hypothetical protein